MATKNISDLTLADTLTGSEIIPVVQAGTTKKATPDQISDLIAETVLAAEASAAASAATAVAVTSGLADSSGASLVGFLQSGTGAVARTMQDKAREAHLSPEDFGAVGDGVADDYAAWSALVSVANALGAGVKIQCGFGKTYLLDQYLHSGGTATQLAFTGIDRLHIDLNGSALKVKGDFARDASTTFSMSAIKLVTCSDVVIENGSLDGSVDETTNPSGYAETQSHGIFLVGVNKCTLRNLEIHHFASDGIYVGGNGNDASTYVATKFLTAHDCVSRNNARQAMSITMAHEALFVRCKFINTGFTAAGSAATAGAYGYHSPAAGVDIEPNTIDRFAQDAPTQGIQFIECVFRDNQNYQCLVATPARVERVKWVRCLIDARNGTGSYRNAQYNFWPGCIDSLVEDCEIYGNIATTSQAETPDRVGTLMIRGCTFYCATNVSTETFVFGAASTDVDHVVENCRFIYKQDVVFPGAGTSGFPRIAGSASHFQFNNNEIIIADHAHPKAYDSGAAAAWPVAKLSGSTVFARNNRYSVRQMVDTAWKELSYYAAGTIASTTDGNVYLVTVAGKSASTKPTHTTGTATDGTVTWKYLPTLPAGAYFYSLMSSSATLDNDQYLDASRWAPTNAVYPAGVYEHSYSKKIVAQGIKLLATDGGSGVTHYIGAAAPTTGTYKRGDAVFNSAPSATTPLGWICTVAGTPGTWEVFGGTNVSYGTAAPVAGTYTRGARVYNSTPAAGGKMGWVCVTAGTPGTWVPFGSIQAANAYTVTNGVTNRTFDANAGALTASAAYVQAEAQTVSDAVAALADVVGTMIADLKASGVFQ